MKYKKHIGKLGEDFATEILREKGYEILDRNFWTRYGEIDIVASHAGKLHFIEVKTRTGTDFGYPSEAVGREKKMHMRKAVATYLQIKKLGAVSVSMDVMEITANHITDCI